MTLRSGRLPAFVWRSLAVAGIMCGMAFTSEEEARHLRKLAALVTQRRVALGIRSKLKAAEHCGIADFTYRKIEKGIRVSDTVYAQVDVGFGFLSESCLAVADGRSDRITLHDGTVLIEGGQIRDFKTPDLEDELDRAFDKSAQLVAPHLTQGESKAIKEEMFRHLRDRGVLNPD